MFTIEENPRVGGWGAEIVSLVADEAMYDLDAPLVRITTPHIPLPSAAALEDLAVPSVDRIVETVTRRLDEARRGGHGHRRDRGDRTWAAPSACALRAAGHDIVAWNRTPEVCDVLAAELGGRSVVRPAEVSAAADATISMLADGAAVDRSTADPMVWSPARDRARSSSTLHGAPRGPPPARGRHPRTRRWRARRAGLGQRRPRRERPADADGRWRAARRRGGPTGARRPMAHRSSTSVRSAAAPR